MENNERDRKLDQWLDEALSEYDAAEPRFGLEQRVLNRIRGEERQSTKWNFWRWMPAFGAIAAVIVVAVAVGPMLTRKATVRQTQERIDTNLRPAEQGPKSTSTEPLREKADVTTKTTNQQELNDTSRGAPPLRRELAIVPQKETVPKSADRDRLISSQAAQIDAQQRAARTYDKKEPVRGSNIAMLNGSVATPPPPPPPIAQVQPGAVGGVIGGIVSNMPPSAAKVAPNTTKENELKASSQGVVVQAIPPPLSIDKNAVESTAVLAKDSRRKEAHAKPETASQDANVIDAFGVKVRFQTGPTTPTQQFPTPAPLSKQEKLALAAAQQLKDSAITQHKSTEIAPIEIKDVEIKPLEGPEK